MIITVKRKFKGERYTVGDLYLDGVYFCNTIEDRVRKLPVTCPNTCKGKDCRCKEKVYAETAIPAGRYKLTITYSPKFKRFLPYLHDVPHFIGIRIHSGVDEKHSAGCIIVGNNCIKGKVLDSREILDRLMKILVEQKEIVIIIEN